MAAYIKVTDKHQSHTKAKNCTSEVQQLHDRILNGSQIITRHLKMQIKSSSQAAQQEVSHRISGQITLEL